MLEIRIAKEQEIEEIARLEQEIFPDPWSLTALRDTWNQKQAQILGAWLDGQMAGYVIVYFAADESEIARIAVDKNFYTNPTEDAILMSRGLGR